MVRVLTITCRLYFDLGECKRTAPPPHPMQHTQCTHCFDRWFRTMASTASIAYLLAFIVKEETRLNCDTRPKSDQKNMAAHSSVCH